MDTIDMTDKTNWQSDPRITRFTELLMNQLHTEAEALQIREEMIDHIDCLMADYLSRDYSYDKAIITTLKQMGDPTMIGYAFTDPDIMKRRNFFLWLFKSFSALFILTIIGVIVLTTPTLPDLAEASSFLMFIGVYITLLLSFKKGSTKLRYLDIDAKPLLIVWPVKVKISKINLAIGSFIALVFSPLLIFFVVGIFSELYNTNGLFATLICTVSTFLALGFAYYSEKFRIPKHILCEEGIITKGRLTPWIAFDKIRIQNDFMGATTNKTVELMDNRSIPMHKKLKVHEQQIEMVKSIIFDKI